MKAWLGFTFVFAVSGKDFLSKQATLAPETQMGFQTDGDSASLSVVSGNGTDFYTYNMTSFPLEHAHDASCSMRSFELCLPVQVEGFGAKCNIHNVHTVDIPQINGGTACEYPVGTVTSTTNDCRNERCMDGEALHNDEYCVGSFTTAFCVKEGGECVMKKRYQVLRPNRGKGEACPHPEGHTVKLGFCLNAACPLTEEAMIAEKSAEVTV